MKDKIKSFITVIIVSVFILVFGIFLIFSEKNIYSETERRKLEEFPDAKLSQILSGEYMSDFEKAAVDQFPLRDLFRKIKAYAVTKALIQTDNNGIFTCGNHISKLEYPLKYEMLDYAAGRFENIFKSYFEGTDAKIYFSVIPDKNLYLAKEKDILTLDYNNMISYMRKKTEYMDYIDIIPLLSADDYYYTDTHWKQQNIIDVADYIAQKMETTITREYVEKTANKKFHGVYYSQSAMSFPPDKLNYLTNKTIDNLIVTVYPDGNPQSSTVYNMEKAVGRDPYEMFLSGNQPIVEIENKLNGNKKNLIIFRDSFGSSLAPLLASGYSRITLIDIRYIQPTALFEFIGNDTDDVLFMYSSLILNSSLSLR